MPALTRPQKITFGDMRDMGVHGLLIYCADYHCSHPTAISADHWPDDLRLSDLEPRFICSACGKRGADVRPDFNWGKMPVAMMGFRWPSPNRKMSARPQVLHFCRQARVQTPPTPPWGLFLSQMLTHLLKSHLSASAAGAKTIDSKVSLTQSQPAAIASAMGTQSV